jgi:hypothetical protein
MSKTKKDVIPKQSHKNITEYYDIMWLTSKGISEDFLEELPTNLKCDILYYKYKDAFMFNPIFLDKMGFMDEPLIKSIIQVMDIRVYQKNDFIVKVG